MMKSRDVFCCAISAMLALPAMLPAQQGSGGAGGLFTRSTDIGSARKGATDFDAAHGTYRVAGGGADMWGEMDAFHFTWVRMSGDGSLTAEVHFGPGSHAALEKGVLMFRESLDPGSAYADVAIHGDGHITLQYRSTAAGKTEDQTAPGKGPTRLRIERKGDRFIASTATDGGGWTAFSSTQVHLKDPVYVGIGVCSHDAEGLATVMFSNVTIEGARAAAVKRVGD